MVSDLPSRADAQKEIARLFCQQFKITLASYNAKFGFVNLLYRLTCKFRFNNVSDDDKGFRRSMSKNHFCTSLRLLS